MRIAVAGASSPLGRRVSRDLAESPEVTRLLLIDGDHSRLELAPASSNVTHASVDEAMDEAEIALGCIDADPDLERDVAEVAIAKGIPYLSACQDIDSLEVLAALDARARDRGALILAGAGFSPGVTSVLVRAAAAVMDEVTTIRVAWAVSAGGAWGQEIFRRAMRAMSGAVPVFEDGGWQRRRAGSATAAVFFAEPVGYARVALCAGAEALTMPAAFEGLRDVRVLGGVTERSVDRLIRKISDVSALSASQRKERLARAASPLLFRLGGRPRGTWSAARVDVEGITEGRVRRMVLGVVDQFPNLISASLISAALMASRGSIKGAGTVAPESAIEPNEFFALLRDRGVRVARLAD